MIADTSTKRILLVGESNPYGEDPEFALYPLPDHASGARLQRVLGLTMGEYLRRHDRLNLCAEGRWSVPVARAAALAVWENRQKLHYPSGIVLCGAKVAAAFDVTYKPCYTTYPANSKVALLVLPHPSGRNRAWNDPGVARDARAAYEALWTLVHPEVQA